MKLPNKLSDENLDYQFDFAKRIDTGDAITASTAILKSGDVTIGTCTFAGTVVTFWLSGGTAGKSNVVEIEITTQGGRVLAELAHVQVTG